MNREQPSQSNPKTPLPAQFLGVQAAAGGPFALLGVGYDVDEQQVLRARDRRLAQIEQHPHRMTPDANEVRLAVYAAASQLLDTNLRIQLQQRWPEGVHVSDPPAWQSGRQTQLPSSIIHMARITLAMCGGWNSKARRRLAHLARIHRIPAIELIGSLGRPTNIKQTSQHRFSKKISLIQPTNSLSSWWIIYGLLCLMIAVLGYRAFHIYGSLQPQSMALVVSPDTDEPKLQSPLRNAQTEQSVRAIRHYSALIHEINQATRRAPEDPIGAAKQVDRYLPDFFAQWIEFPPEDLEKTAAQLLIIDTYTRSNTEANQIMAKAVGISISLENPVQVAASLSVRRLISVSKKDRPSFSEVLHDSIERIAIESQTDDPVWWSSWTLAAGALHRDDTDAKAELVLAGLSARLGNEKSSRSWAKTASILVNELSWRAGSAERVWLLGALIDHAYTAARLAALTEAIATHSSASGVQINMVLDPSATMNDRYTLADQYRSAWKKSGTDADSFLDRLGDELLATISLTGASLDETAAQRQFANLAHLNTICWIYQRGRHAEAQSLFEKAPSAIVNSDSISSLGIDGQASDDQWAQKLINAKTGQDEIDLINTLEIQGAIGVNTAHALVLISTTGDSRESRNAAGRLIQANASNIPILIALDQFLIARRTTVRFRELLNSIFPIDSQASGEDWDRLAHRALLTAIADSVGAMQFPNATAFGTFVTTQYAARLETSDYQIGSSTKLVLERLLVDLGASCLQLSLNPESIEAIFRRRTLRSARASNAAQYFVADQWALIDLHAMHTAETIAGSADQVTQVVTELKTRMRQSPTVEDQIAQLERAQSQIWLIIFREGRL